MITLLKPATDRTKIIGICFVLIAMVWIVFGQTLSFDFLNYDDDQYVTKNLLVTGGITARGIDYVFTHNDYSFYHPLTTLSHMLDYQMYGMNPAGFHFTNVLLHTVSVVLLFLVLRSMTGSLWRSALVAAVYAIHPLRAESVAWVTERKDTLSGLFFMLMLGAYTRYARGREQRAESREQRAAVFRPLSSGSYWLVFLFMAAGMLSKATLVTAPFVLLLLDFWPLGRFRGQRTEDRCQMNCRTGLSSEGPCKGERHVPSDGQAHPTMSGSACPMDGRVLQPNPHQPSTNNYQLLLEKLPFLLLLAVICPITVLTNDDGMLLMKKTPVFLRLSNAVVSYATYIGQSVFPARLTVFYPYPVEHFPLWKSGGALLFLGLVTFAVLAGWRKRPYLLTGWFWYLGMLAPVIGVMRCGDQAHADRYTYLAQIGLVILPVWAVADLCARWKIRRAFVFSAAIAGLTALCATAYIQTTHWRDSFRLWSHALACTDGNYMAHTGMGNVFLDEGKLDEAVQHYQQSIRINPDYLGAYGNLGCAFLRQKTPGKAIECLESALKIYPEDILIRLNLANAIFYNNLGCAHMFQGNFNKAIWYLERGLEIDPEDTILREILNTTLRLQKEAVQRAQPWLQAGIRSHMAGNFAAAIRQYEQALQLYSDYAEAKNNLAWLLATCPDAALRDGRRAVELMESMTDDRTDPSVLDTLAATYAEAGRYPEAAATARRALELMRAQGNGSSIEPLRARLERYEAGLPYHESAK